MFTPSTTKVIIKFSNRFFFVIKQEYFAITCEFVAKQASSSPTPSSRVDLRILCLKYLKSRSPFFWKYELDVKGKLNKRLFFCLH